MNWQQRPSAARMKEAMQNLVGGALLIVATIIAIGLIYTVAQIVWHLLGLLNRTLFANPW